MTGKATHECCPDAAKFLAGYPSRVDGSVYNWHLIGIDRYCTHCPWCGVSLEYKRRVPMGFGCVLAIGDKVTLRAVPSRRVTIDRVLVVNGTAVELRVDGAVSQALGAGVVLLPGSMLELDAVPHVCNTPLELRLERWKLGRALLWLLGRPIRVVCAAAMCTLFVE